MLSRHIPTLRAFLPQARISRVDISFDVGGVRFGQILAFTKSARTQHLPYPTAFYIGAKKSQQRLLVYDKLKQEFGNGPYLLMRGPNDVPLHLRSITRFEFRFNRLCKISEVGHLENKLCNFYVALVEKVRKLDLSPRWQSFVQDCVTEGAQARLARYSNPLVRARLRTALSRGEPGWFDREQIWAEAKLSLASVLIA
jgi:hypothetical protein